MTATEKRKEEQEELLKNRKSRILSSAFELFSEKGIDTITMNDIAKKAEIGVASLYRYYETKDEIAIQTAIWAWQKQTIIFLPELSCDEYLNRNGLQQMEFIIELYSRLYQTNPDFLRFIYFFDSYAVRTGLNQHRLIEYEKIVREITNIVFNVIDKGICDKSIKEEFAVQKKELCSTIMQTFFSLSQKLTLNKNLLSVDKTNNGKESILLLSKIILEGIKER